MLILLTLLVSSVLCHESFHIDPKDSDVKEHLKEHFDEVADDVSLNTDNDVYFGYFNVHDTDKDGYLDGLELLSSFNDHRATKSKEDTDYEKELKNYCNVVDQTLKDFDKNNDGLISLSEYIGQVKH